MEITRITLLAAFVTSFVLALIFSPVAMKLAPKIGAMDVPKDARRMHSKAMPRFGGLAIFIGTIASLLIYAGDNEKNSCGCCRRYFDLPIGDNRRFGESGCEN